MKRMKRRLLRNAVSGALALLLIATTVSCEVGLGASVDVDRPTTEILYPPRNAVIRDKFVLSGTAVDDKGIDYVKVTLTNVSSGNKETFDYTIPQNGALQSTWSINLNEKLSYNADLDVATWLFPDGNYSIDVETIDLEGKSSGISSITVAIDNTAPFFIASKPGSKLYKNPSKYGANLRVTGTVAEDHDLAKMEMKVYNIDSTNGNKKDSDGDGTPDDPIAVANGLIEEDVATAGGVKVSFANSNAASGNTYKTRYDTLYAENADPDNNPSITFLTEIELTDSARIYQNPSDKDGVAGGNSTKQFYLTDDLLPLTGNGADRSGNARLGLNAGEIKDVTNNTSTITDSAKINTIVNTLTEKKRSTAYFSLNPNNNPTYDIGSSRFEDTVSDITTISPTANKGISLSVQFAAGRDEIEVVASSTALYLVGPVASEDYIALKDKIFNSTQWLGTPTTEKKTLGSETYVEYTYPNPEIPTELSAKGVGITKLPNTKVRLDPSDPNYDASASDYRLDGKATGLNYSYKIENVSSGFYYFLVGVGEDADGTPIQPADGYYYGFKGTSSGLPPTIEIDAGLGDNYKNLENSTNTNLSDSDATVANRKILFTGISTGGDGVVDKVLYNLTIKGGASDVTLSNQEAAEVDFSGENKKWKVELPVNTYLNDGEVRTFEFTFWTKNKGAGADAAKSSDAYRSITVDLQKPTVDFSGITPVVDYEGEKCVNGVVKVDVTANDKTRLTSWGYKIYVEGVTDPVAEETITDLTLNSFTFNTDNSIYNNKKFEIKLTAKDDAGNEAEVKSSNNYKLAAGKKYVINQDSDKPVIDVSGSIESTTETDIVKKSKVNLFTVAGKTAGSIAVNVVDDDNNGVKEITVTYKKWNGTAFAGTATTMYSDSTFAAQEVNKNIDLVLNNTAAGKQKPMEPGIYEVTIIAKDEDGTASVPCTFVIGVTSGAPSIRVTSQANQWLSSGKEITIEGEKVNGSLQTVSRTYTLKNTSGATVTPPTGSSPVTKTLTPENDKFDDKVKIADSIKTGKVVVTYTGKDEYGQESEPVTFEYDIDGNKPTVSAAYEWEGGSAPTAAYSKLNKIKLTPTVSDGTGESGMASTAYALVTSNSCPAKDASDWVVFTDTTRTITVPDGVNYIFVRALDNAGNDNYTTAQTLNVDNAKPVLTITKPASYTNGNENISIPVSIVDAAGLNETAAIKVVVKGAKKAAPETIVSVLSKNIASSSFTKTGTTYTDTYSLPKATIQALAEGSFSVTITAKDLGGNTTAETFNMVYDVVGPLVEVTSPAVGEWITASSVTVNGTCTDESTVSAVWYKKADSVTLPAGDKTKDSTWTNAGWTKASGSTSWNFRVQDIPDGSLKFFIAAVDQHGNVRTEVKSHSINKDTGKPTITLTKYGKDAANAPATAVPSGELPLNVKTFSLSGAYSDNASAVTITAKRKLGAAAAVDVSSSITKTPASAGALNGTWTLKEATALEEGTYVYTITATDQTGKSAEVTKTVIVDTTAPAFSSMKVNTYDYSEGRWSGDPSSSLNGTWTESGSGVDHFEYWQKTNGTALTTAELASPTGTLNPTQNGNNWSFTQNFNFNDGENYFFIRAVDKAGNKSTPTPYTNAENATPRAFHFNVDTTAPTLTVTKTGSGDGYTWDNGKLYVTKTLLGENNLKLNLNVKEKTGFYLNTWGMAAVFTNEVAPNEKQANGKALAYNWEDSSVGTVPGMVGFVASLDPANIKKNNPAITEATGVITVKNLADGENTIYVYGMDFVYNYAQESIQVYVDKDKPTVVYDTTNLIRNANSNYNVNGIVTVTGTADDDDKVASTTCSVYNKADVTLTNGEVTVANGKTAVTDTGLFPTVNGNTERKWTYKIDSTRLTNKADYVIVLTVTDRAGNKAYYGQEIHVDQDTDIPSISESNFAWDAIATAYNGSNEGIHEGFNLFEKSGNNKIMAFIEDDDAVSKVTADYRANGSTEWITFFEKTGINSPTYSMSAPLVTTENGSTALGNGKWYIRIKAYDTNDVSRTSDNFLIAIDSDSPAFTVTTVDGKTYAAGMDVLDGKAVVFTVTDDTEPSKVEYSTDNGTTWSSTGVSSTGSGTTKTFTHTGATGSSSGTVTYLYRATDIFDRKTTKTVTFAVDKTAPTATPAGKVTVEYAGASNTKNTVAYTALSSAWINKSSIEVKGAAGVVADTENKLSTSATVTVSGATTGTTPLELNENFSFADERSLEDGKSTINYAFTDKAGHGVDFDVTVNVDTTAPIVTVNTAKIKAGATELSAASVINANSVTVSFTAQDAFGGPSATAAANKVVSKLLKAEIGNGYKFTTVLKTLDWSSTKPASQTVADQSIDISTFDDGETELFVRLYDNAGNVSNDISLGKFIIDRANPKVDYDGLRAGATVYKTISFTAKCTDNNLAADAKPVVKVGSTVIFNGTTSTIGMTATQNATTKVWTFANIDTTKTGFTDKADNTFQVIFTDKAGNSSTETLTVKVDQDADRPVIVFDNLDPTTKTTVTTNRISGSISDNETITYFGYRYGDSGDYTKITISNGNWSFQDNTKSAEATYKLYFKVTAGGNDFETAAGSGLTTPKMRLSGNSSSTGAPFEFAIDNTPPVIGRVYIAVSEDNGATYGKFTEFANSTWFGGKKTKAKLRIQATDNIKSTDGALDVKLKFQDQADAAAVSATWHTSKGDTDPAGYEYEVTFPSTIGTGAANESTLYLIHILAKDDTVNPSRKTLNVSIDNSGAHKLSNTAPASSLTVTGDVSLRGYVRDEKLYSGLAKMEYCIPTYTAVNKAANAAVPVLPDDKTAGNTYTWTSEDNNGALSRSSTSWTLTLTDLQSDGNINSNYGGYFDSTTQTYLIPVWFRFTDAVGNLSYDKHVVKYDPDADKPSLEITSPVEKYDATYKMSYVTLGGEIRIMGTASDNEGVDAIYVQYDVNGDGRFDDTDKAWLNRNGYTVVDLSTIATNLSGESNDSKWGVKATGSYNWQARFNAGKLATDNETKNISLEVGAAANKGKKTLNIRCRVLDDDTGSVLASGWSDIIHVSVNNLIPAFSEFKLNRYSTSAGTGKPLESISYEPDMYISGGNWFLEGSVTDETSFAELKIDNTRIFDGTTFTTTTGVTKSNNKAFTFKFPISGTTFTKTIYVLDNDSDTTGGQKSNDVSFNINIDSVAPAFVNKSNAASSLEIYQDQYGTDANKLSDTVFLKNSNGSLVTVSSKVSETGAGFKTAAIYLKRPGKTGKAYNVYKNSTGTSTGYGTEEITASETADKVFYKDNMPVLKKSATPTAVNKFTVTDIGSNNFVRESGLVYINGGYRTIMGITGDEITLDSNVVPAPTQTAVDVYFVYAMTVNNKSETHDADGIIRNDDRDGLEETYTTSGPYTTWEATFDSSKISDGDVEIHVVVFDRAGNMVHGQVDTRISNNPPRIARVTLATEFNGVSGYQDFEKQTYYALNETATQKTKDATAGVKIWNLDTTVASSDKPAGELWTMKNGLILIPEIVGGNGSEFYYRAEKIITYADATALSGAKALTDTEKTRNTFKNKDTVTLDNSKIVTTTGENGTVAYKFSIWDETEGQTPGKGYEGTVLNLKVKQDIVDNEKPVTVVDKFFWVDNTNNSLYGNSSNNGHIELEADVTAAQSITGYPSSSLTAGAPKVSGKITIRGSAYDNHRLSSLWISAREGTNEMFAFLNETVEGENKVSNKDSSTNSPTKDYYKVAEYTPGTGWSSAIDKFTSAGWEWKFTVTKDELTQHGHYVEWQLDWDTQKMTAKTKKGLVFTMLAKDAANNVTLGTNDTEASAPADLTANHGRNRPTYTMDVVPYIKAVKTALSSDKNAKNASVYNRTALGNYPVRTPATNRTAKSTTNHVNDVDLSTTAETVVLYGFNLNHTTKDVTSGTNVSVTTDAKASGDTYVTYDCETASFSVAGLASGNLAMTVNGVPIINNYNNNDAKGSTDRALTTYTNANKYGYNRVPNNSNNNNLTDDVVFDVWEFNDKAALPLNGLLGGVKMQINPVNNMIQYAFSNGSQYMSMGGKARSVDYGTTSGNSYSSKYWSMDWDTYSAESIGFHIDKNGNTYATAQGGDTHGSYGETGGADMFDLFSDRITGEGRKSCSPSNNHTGAYSLVSSHYGDNMDKQRVQSVSMASNGNNFYMAYYDALTNHIAFRATVWGDSGPDTGNMFASTEGNYQAIAGTGVTETGHVSAGGYVSIAVVPGTNDTVVAVWYDGQSLKYAYISNPIENINTIKNNKNAANWTGTKTIFASGGLDCQIKVDSSNGIHIAAQDSSGNVKYAYLSSFDATYSESANSCFVDCGSVGANLTLDVASDGTNQVPFISYYSSENKKPKYATRKVFTSLGDGMQNKKTYSGNWEVSYVPTSSRLIMNTAEKINVGVWKNSDGELIWSTTNGKDPNETGDNKGTVGSSYEKVTGASNSSTCISVTYGNGSKNAVLGYQIGYGGGSCLETAQKR